MELSLSSGGEWTPIVMMLVINCALGLVNALVKKVLDGGINHMIVATYRLLISTIFLAPIAYFWERKTRPKLTFHILCQHFFSGLLGASLTQYFFLLGLARTSATLSCAFLSMSPAVTFILALALGQEKLKIKSRATQAKVLGMLICVGGALCLTLYKGLPLTSTHWQAKAHTAHRAMHSTGKRNWIVGSILLFAGCTFSSSWSFLQAKINKAYPCKYSSITIMSFFGAIQSALLSLISERRPSKWVLKDKFDILTIVYAGVVAQGVCTVGLSWCIKKRGPLFTSTFAPIMLIFATIFDFFVFHESIYLGSVLGSLFAIVGLYIFLWGKNKETTKECVLKQTQRAEEDEARNTVPPHIVPMTP